MTTTAATMTLTGERKPLLCPWMSRKAAALTPPNIVR